MKKAVRISLFDKSHPKNLKILKQSSKKIKKNLIKLIKDVEYGHINSCLSCIDILLALYSEINFNPKKPDLKDRDMVILSKGHAVAALYAVFLELGMLTEKEIRSFCSLGSDLQGHPGKPMLGVEVSTGSLGQGLSIGNGIALSAKLENNKKKIFVILGDGELNEGQIWEAAMTASQNKLNNVIAIIDRNKVQGTGPTKKVKDTDPLSKKWESFGWDIIEVDGHNFEELIEALKIAQGSKNHPTVIIADTTKSVEILA